MDDDPPPVLPYHKPPPPYRWKTPMVLAKVIAFFGAIFGAMYVVAWVCERMRGE